MNRPPALLFGVPVADLTMVEALRLIDELVADGRMRGRTNQVATVNVDFLVHALNDPSVASILQQADVCLADGMPIVWGARLLGMSIRERVAGSDLVPLLVQASATTGRHVHLFGSTPEVADAASRIFRQRYPAARFSIDPGPEVVDVDRVDRATLGSIAEVDPDILCVALGNPKQERFIRAYRDDLRTPVMIGVGGSLDMLVGKRRRAPRWVQRVGLEWVVRAAQEPRRLGQRYLRDIAVFAPAFTRLWLGSHKQRNGVGLRLHLTDDSVEVRLEGNTLATELQWCRAERELAQGSTLLVVATHSNVRYQAMAQLVGLVHAASRASGLVEWESDADRLVTQLDSLSLTPEMLGITRDPRR